MRPRVYKDLTQEHKDTIRQRLGVIYHELQDLYALAVRQCGPTARVSQRLMFLPDIVRRARTKLVDEDVI